MVNYNDFFTLQSLGTFAGAVGATTVVSNGLQRAANFNPKWLALALAEIICLVIVYYTHANAPADTPPLSSDYFVAVVNGFLVYCSAAGVTDVGGTALGGGSTPKGSSGAQDSGAGGPAPAPAESRGTTEPRAVAPGARVFWSSWHGER